MTRQEYNDYTARVEWFFETFVKTAHFAVNTDTDSDEYHEFRHAPCECCKRPLAGARYTARTFGTDESGGYGELDSFLICVDCMYYAEYGQLDDMTMIEVARDDERIAAEDADRIEQMTDAYIECALWSSTDDDGEPLDRNYSTADISREEQNKMRSDVAGFYEKHKADLERFVELYRARGWKETENKRTWFFWEDVGHCFWLSRNGHGAGFFDRFDHRDSEEAQTLGDRLQAAARAFGEAHLMVGAGETGDADALYYFNS